MSETYGLQEDELWTCEMYENYEIDFAYITQQKELLRKIKTTDHIKKVLD